MNFFSILKDRVNKINSLLCVGLDPHIEQLKEPTAQAAETFCYNLIDQTKDVAVAYKPNSAFFEVFGAEGMACLERVIAYIPDDIPVLLDSKRGDISTTAAAYASSAFDRFKAHAITLAPYMGRDSIDPFVGNHPSRGCFILCKTSNKSANEIQTLKCSHDVNTLNGRMLYEEIALLAQRWSQHDNIGLVVGATDVEALSRIRAIVPNMWILAPGIGAQGGNLKEALNAGLDKDGMGMLIPISRGISKAKDPYQTSIELRDAINEIRQQKITLNDKDSMKKNKTNANEFIDFALSCNVLRFGQFTLKSGRISPYFFNAGLFNHGKALARLGNFYAKAIYESGVSYDVLFGPAYKGITLVAAISISLWNLYGLDVPYTYNRKEAKDHGEGGLLVGASVEGKKVLIVDDVITAGTAIKEAMGILENAKAIACGVCISLDRQEKVSETENLSAIEIVEQNYSIPVISIACLMDLIFYLEDPSMKELKEKHWTNVTNYRQRYGVEKKR